MISRKNLYHVILISIVFSSFFLLILPFQPTVAVSIAATGEKNTLSKGTEVWLQIPARSGGFNSTVLGDQGWTMQDRQLVSAKHQPAKLALQLPLSSDSKIVFGMHPWSGIVEVEVNGQNQKFDLYKESPGAIELRLDSLSTSPIAIDKVATFFSLAKTFGVTGFLFASLAAILLARLPENRAQEVNSSDCVRAVYYAVPSILIYLTVHLAFWPGQMSPDSLDQWHQAATGQNLNDAHPIFSTLLIRFAYLVYPSPGLAVAFQYTAYALATGLILNEFRRWGVKTWLIGLIALLFPLFPANFLIVTTLWKDVPFATGMLLLAFFGIRAVRLNFQLTKLDFIGLALACILVLSTRHYGILITIPFCIALFVVARHSSVRWIFAVVASIQFVAFLALKTIVLSSVGASPTPPQYHSIHALHVLGAMISNEARFSPDEVAVISRIMPLEKWREGYDCRSVGGLFASKYASAKSLASESAALNLLAINVAIKNPAIFFHHRLCVTSVIWRIQPMFNERIPISPLGIEQIDLAYQQNLATASKLPELQTVIKEIHRKYLEISAPSNRAAGFLLVGIFMALMAVIRIERRSWIVLAPSILNCVALTVLIPAPDYRYLWPSIIGALLMTIFALFAYRSYNFKSSSM